MTETLSTKRLLREIKKSLSQVASCKMKPENRDRMTNELQLERFKRSFFSYVSYVSINNVNLPQEVSDWKGQNKSNSPLRVKLLKQSSNIFWLLSLPFITTYPNLGITCCARLATHVVTCCDMLSVVSSSLKMVKFFMQHLWMLNKVLLVWPGSCNSFAPGHAHYKFDRFLSSKHVDGEGGNWVNRNAGEPSLLVEHLWEMLSFNIKALCIFWVAAIPRTHQIFKFAHAGRLGNINTHNVAWVLPFAQHFATRRFIKIIDWHNPTMIQRFKNVKINKEM